MIDYEKVDAAYQRYGYIAKTREGIRVYEYKQGRYFGVDFVNSEETIERQKLIEGYKDQGYAWAVKNYESIEEVDEELFKSFFRVEHFKRNLDAKYDQFIKQQTRSLPEKAQYEYITCPYTFMGYDNDGMSEFEDSKSGNSIVSHVTRLITTTETPLFVIIEAAAGFGKTCSSYELLKNINQLDGDLVPLYVELSRNREARIFKHILLSEIESQFQNIVNSDIVIHEIKQGRIPLIIDGFDELLSKDLSQADSQLRDVESMLSTIVDLLEGKAKIIITSRKTAIFNGEEFFSWMQQQSQIYSVARFTLLEPEIRDWLSDPYISIMDAKEFPISEVANPVLLTYIRNLDVDAFSLLIQTTNSIIDKYFDFLLQRERERQGFEFDNDTQLRILKKLVRIMSEFDIKSENKAFVREIIKDSNDTIFEDYIRKSKAVPKPTKDELSDTLSNHALLDRKKNNEVGIINEFILGYLVGRNLIDGDYQRHSKNNDYTDIISQELALSAVFAFKVQTKDNRVKLHEVLTLSGFSYSVEFNLNRDIALLGKASGVYRSGLTSDTTIRGVEFSSEAEFTDYVFSDCVFKKCKFNKKSFINSGFTNCAFHECTWIQEDINSPQKTNISSLYIVGCNATNDFIEKNHTEDIVEENSVASVESIEYKILGFFVREGKQRCNAMKRISHIRAELYEFGNKQIEKALNNLSKNKYVIMNGGMCFIQKEGITYFKNNLQS